MHFAGTDFYYESQVRLAERLTQIVPGSFAKKVFYTNSGTESVEAALKLARWHRQRPITIGLLGAFHGRTMGSSTMTASKLTQRARFQPFAGGGHHIPAPNCFRCPYQLEYPSCDLYCAKILKELYFETSIPPDDVAAFIAEPVMGEGGYVVPPPGLAQGDQVDLRRDTGSCSSTTRSRPGSDGPGKWFAIEHHGVVPDIVTTAKALGSGLPDRRDDRAEGPRLPAPGGPLEHVRRQPRRGRRRPRHARRDRAGEAARELPDPGRAPDATA